MARQGDERAMVEIFKEKYILCSIIGFDYNHLASCFAGMVRYGMKDKTKLLQET